MPVVFVHGVPDTHRVWHQVIARLHRRDVVTLSLPGFDSPLPDGFDASKEAYLEWLLKALSALPKPIDVVGHDWGALLVMRAVSVQPDIARSWALGGASIDAGYVWHQMAQLWQTPGVGEQVMRGMTPEVIQAALVSASVPDADAAEAAQYIDATMKDCILKLYRSAIQVGAEWQAELAHVEAPGLVLWGEKDPYVTPDFGARMAERTHARFISFPNCSHWWQLERPDEVAAGLQQFWATLSSSS
ncbi:MAG: alpha/beta hydrolase [Acidobacteriota bacterium]